MHIFFNMFALWMFGTELENPEEEETDVPEKVEHEAKG